MVLIPKGWVCLYFCLILESEFLSFVLLLRVCSLCLGLYFVLLSGLVGCEMVGCSGVYLFYFCVWICWLLGLAYVVGLRCDLRLFHFF